MPNKRNNLSVILSNLRSEIRLTGRIENISSLIFEDTVVQDANNLNRGDIITIKHYY